jgi:predicted RNA binding protein YcfA (HicA-like mRNA interferase family)
LTTFSKDVFDRLKNISKHDFIKALEKDGFVRDVESRQGAILVYWHATGRRVTVHWHPKTGFGRDQLKKGCRGRVLPLDVRRAADCPFVA